MSQLSYAWEQAPVEESSSPIGVDSWVETPQRSVWQLVLLALPVIIAIGANVAGSAPLTDVAFLLLTVFCSIFVFNELRYFAERYGVGGIVLYAGVLIWFCYDYFRFWFLDWKGPSWTGVFPPSVVARAAMYYMIYIWCMALGLRIKWGQWFPRLLTKFPEPPAPSNYFIIVLVTQVIGLIPYAIWTREPFYLAIYHQMTAGRAAGGTQWTVGRTGNLNFSYGGYVAELLTIGNGGAIAASFCMVFLRQGMVKNIICGAIWLLWLALGFGTGTRGAVVVLVLPMVCFIFIRFHVQAQEMLKKFSARAYVVVGAIILVAIIAIQIQIFYRNKGFHNVDLSEVSLTKIEGNEMFSTSLLGFSYIPERHDIYYDEFPGEAVVLPIPGFIFWAAIAPAPRAIWTAKPVDPFWKWYNAVSTGRTTLGGGTSEGTTISEGIVGYWYFRYGLAGVIEGGIFMGWLMGVFERALYNNGGKPLTFLASMALLTWMFRTYRDPDLQDLADTGVMLAGLVLAMLLARPLLAPTAQHAGA